MTSFTKLRDKLVTGGGNILVIQTAFLGDVVLLTPLLRAIRRALPRVEVSVVVQPEWSEIVAGWCDEVIPFAKRDPAQRAQNWRELIGKLKRRRFDAALVPHRSLRSALTALKAEIPHRIGFRRGVAGLLHHTKVPYKPTLYEGRRNLDLLRKLTEIDDDGLPELTPSAADVNVVGERLHSLALPIKSFVVLAPASVWFTKEWHRLNYRALASRLQTEFRLPVVAVGAEADRELCAGVVGEPNLNLAGGLTPLQTAALMAQSRLVISGDTAPAHIATSAKARQLIIFGSTTPRFGFAPPTPQARILGADLWCRPCTNHGRQRCPLGKSPRCLTSLTVQNVVDSIRDWLKPEANGAISKVNLA